jgi:hypothetical protein
VHCASASQPAHALATAGSPSGNAVAKQLDQLATSQNNGNFKVSKLKQLAEQRPAPRSAQIEAAIVVWRDTESLVATMLRPPATVTLHLANITQKYQSGAPAGKFYLEVRQGLIVANVDESVQDRQREYPAPAQIKPRFARVVQSALTALREGGTRSVSQRAYRRSTNHQHVVGAKGELAE